MMKWAALLGTRWGEGAGRERPLSLQTSSGPGLSHKHVKTPSRGPNFCPLPCRVLGEGLLPLTLIYGLLRA